MALIDEMRQEENEMVYEEMLTEMANRRKSATGLPVNIWIDENGSYKKGGHGKRIKVQLNYGEKMQNQPFCSMNLEGTVIENSFDKRKCEVSENDLQAVSNYVVNNAYALSKVCDEEIFMEDYDAVSIKGGKPASEKQKNELKQKVDAIISKKGGAMTLIDEMREEENEMLYEEMITEMEESNFHSLREMARIGEFSCRGLFLINVYSNEGNIPHFHILKKATKEETCIRIDSAEYFLHGKNQLMLNSKEKKILNEYLHSVSEFEEDGGKTIYMLIWEEWNRNNRENRMDRPSGIPDYRELG